MINIFFVFIHYFFGILISLFSVLFIVMAMGIINIDDIISFLNLEDSVAIALKGIYQKISEAAGNLSSIIYDIFANFFGDSQINNETEVKNIIGDAKE